MKKIVLLLLLAGIVLGGCNRKTARTSKSKTKTTKTAKTTKPIKGIRFDKGVAYSKILKQAKAQNKPIFIEFYTTWCSPCKWIQKDVFELDQVGKLFNENFINIKVDAEKGEGPTLAAQFGVMGFPTLIYLDSNGDVVDSQLGMTTATKVMDKARRTMEANKALVGAGSM